ncbi:MAG: IS3 family transposase [Firmicutes bacterium]|nr:IS3 family transposase [Bacillota bacterium]
MTKQSAIDALKHAIDRRRPAPGLVHHSDRGSQYASHEYQELLRKHGFISNMSRKGNCWDNACAESFFHTLKTELVYLHRYRTRAETKHQIFEYIEVYYNRYRLHSSLGYENPYFYENQSKAS